MMNNGSKKNSHTRFFCLLFLLLGLCFVRYALQINFPRSLLLVVVALIAVFGNRDEIIAMMICCIPLDTSIHIFYALFICLAIFILKYYRDFYINSGIIPILLMIIWELLHCFGKPFSIMTMGTNFVPFLVLGFLMFYRRDEIDYPLICRALSICIIFMCIMLLGRLLYVARFDVIKAISSLWRLGADTIDAQQSLKVWGGHQNPNTLGIQCVLGMTGLLQLRRMGIGETKDTIQIIVLLIFGALTSSRTYLACLAIMITLFWLSQKGGAHKKFKLLLQVFLLLIVALIVLYAIFPEILEYYLNRLTTKDKYTTRGELFAIYHEFIIGNQDVMFFGTGLQNYYSDLANVYRVSSTVPHNAIQEMVIAWGIPSIALFTSLGLSMIRNSHHFCKKQGLINYIPVLIILAKSMVGQLLDSPYTLLALSFSYISMRQIIDGPN